MGKLTETIERNMAFYKVSMEDLAEAVGCKPETLEKAISSGNIKFKDLAKVAEVLKFTAAQKAYIFG